MDDEPPRTFAELHSAAVQENSPGALLDRVVAPAASKPRRSRRLSDALLLAFHHASDQGDLDVAWRLLVLAEVAHERAPRADIGERRRSVEPLVAAYERLWELRHPEASVEERGNLTELI
ncbi:hypothetical protein [Roseomonas sp. BN140053]|uniref:hypothetical protein n=1 Tax=Roseomonas sp. BN140053 TaxID=3391898 RepID=UPI0039ECC154